MCLVFVSDKIGLLTKGLMSKNIRFLQNEKEMRQDRSELIPCSSDYIIRLLNITRRANANDHYI